MHVFLRESVCVGLRRKSGEGHTDGSERERRGEVLEEGAQQGIIHVQVSYGSVLTGHRVRQQKSHLTGL